MLIYKYHNISVMSMCLKGYDEDTAIRMQNRIMASKTVLVNFAECHPENCENGRCKAAMACNYKLLKQENNYEIPMAAPWACRGCGDCVRACPLKAVLMANN
jgi:heterodisulfide reductase subunit A-like polyferredoxin